MITDYMYELSNYDPNYDPNYDSTFYWHFKIDDTSVARIKRFMRMQLSYDAGYYDDDIRDNTEVLHLLKSVTDVHDLTKVLSKGGYDLKEVGLL